MLRYLLIISFVFATQYGFAQDSAINKMKQSTDRNRVTDTVHVNGSNDNMNVPVPLTSDSLTTNNGITAPTQDTSSITPHAETAPKNENVWVSRGLWIALVAILIVIVVVRRKRAGK